MFKLATALLADAPPAMGFWTVAVVVGIALLGVVWFALRFWLASIRPPKIQDIRTPALDRLNRRALEAMGREDQPEDEEPPKGLKDVVPPEPGAKP
jgi:membrane protein required for beta-lactamase induction